jgi:hypothetical protein
LFAYSEAKNQEEKMTEETKDYNDWCRGIEVGAVTAADMNGEQIATYLGTLRDNEDLFDGPYWSGVKTSLREAYADKGG